MHYILLHRNLFIVYLTDGMYGMYCMSVSCVLRGHFPYTGWMFLVRLSSAWYAGYLDIAEWSVNLTVKNHLTFALMCINVFVYNTDLSYYHLFQYCISHVYLYCMT